MFSLLLGEEEHPLWVLVGKSHNLIDFGLEVTFGTSHQVTTNHCEPYHYYFMIIVPTDFGLEGNHTTFSNGSLGSRSDEERSKARYVL